MVGLKTLLDLFYIFRYTNFKYRGLCPEVVYEICTAYTKIYNHLNKIHLINMLKNEINELETSKYLDSIYLRKDADVWDLWFIIRENDFSTKCLAVEIFCRIVENIPNTFFDILVLTKNEIDSEAIESNGYKLLLKIEHNSQKETTK